MSSSFRQTKQQRLQTEIRVKCESILAYVKDCKKLSDLSDLEDVAETLQGAVETFESIMSSPPAPTMPSGPAWLGQPGGPRNHLAGMNLSGPRPQVHAPGLQPPFRGPQMHAPFPFTPAQRPMNPGFVPGAPIPRAPMGYRNMNLAQQPSISTGGPQTPAPWQMPAPGSLKSPEGVTKDDCLAKYVQSSWESPEFKKEDEPLLSLVEAACDYTTGTEPNPHNRVVLYGKHGTGKKQFAVMAAQGLMSDLLHVDLLTFSDMYHNRELSKVLKEIENAENLVIYVDSIKELMHSGDELKQHALFFLTRLTDCLARKHPGILLFVALDNYYDLPFQLKGQLYTSQIAAPTDDTKLSFIVDELAKYNGQELRHSQLMQLVEEFPKASQASLSMVLGQVYRAACMRLWKGRRFHLKEDDSSKIECCSKPMSCSRPDAYTSYRDIPVDKRPEPIIAYDKVREALRQDSEHGIFLRV